MRRSVEKMLNHGRAHGWRLVDWEAGACKWLQDEDANRSNGKAAPQPSTYRAPDEPTPEQHEANVRHSGEAKEHVAQLRRHDA